MAKQTKDEQYRGKFVVSTESELSIKTMEYIRQHYPKAILGSQYNPVLFWVTGLTEQEILSIPGVIDTVESCERNDTS